MSYSAVPKWWDHVGNLVPNVEYSPSERPHVAAQVAPWLPTGDGVYDKAIEEYYTVLPGKAIAITRDGYLVPAGLRQKFAAAAGTGEALVFSTVDTAERVTDPLTGTYLTAAATVAKSSLTTRWNTLGYIDTSIGEAAEHMISCPIGVAPYAYFNGFYGGTTPSGGNPANLRRHNFSLQEKVAVLMDYVIQLPLVPDIAATAAFTSAGVLAGTATSIATNVLYISMTANRPVAADTPQSSWAFSGGATEWFQYKKSGTRAVRGTGDYFISEDNDTVYFFSTEGTGAVNTQLGTVVYYHYNSTTDPTGVSNYACVVGDVHPGDFLVPTAKSNFKPATSITCNYSIGANGTFGATALANETALGTAILGTEFNTYLKTALETIEDSFKKLETSFGMLEARLSDDAKVIGQVLRVQKWPKGSLDKVRTGYTQASWSSRYQDRMPGSATEGLPDILTYAQGANRTVVINIIHR